LYYSQATTNPFIHVIRCTTRKQLPIRSSTSSVVLINRNQRASVRTNFTNSLLYYIFVRDPDQFRAFQLTGGRYRELTLPDNRLWLPELKLGLGLWEGVYHGLERKWLRWYDADGKWIPTPVEKERQQTEHEKTRADHEKTRAEQEKMRAERLAAQLRALGIEPNI
jgi:hypothetical protein